MLFRRNKPTPVALPVALIAPVTEKDTAQKQQYAVNEFAPTPKSLKEVLSISAKVPIDLSTKHASPTKYCAIPTPVRAQHPQREPSSRKTGHATIYTDATGDHAAFESDAFAVHMPTTRIPIIDRPVAPRRPSPVAQAEAFRTYQEKAHQVRARNHSTGVRVPSKIISYDYASSKIASRDIDQARNHGQPQSPLQPAGSFPVSPSIPQTGWQYPQRVNPIRTQSRRLDEPRRVYTLSKPPGSSNHPVSPEAPPHNSNDSQAGASRSTPSPTQPPPIRIRITPRVSIPEAQRVQAESKKSPRRQSPTISPPMSRSTSPNKSMPNFTRHNSVEGDSLFGYQVKVHADTTAGAGAPSGSDKEKVKSKGKNKAKEEDEIKEKKKEKETELKKEKSKEKIQEKVKAMENAKEKGNAKEKEKAKEKEREKEKEKEKEEKVNAKKIKKPEKPEKVESADNASSKRTLRSRWPWVRPTIPHVDKSVPTPVLTSNTTPKTKPSANTPRRSAYVSPFERHATPPAPALPRNPTTSSPSPARATAPVVPPASQDKFETGFAQLKQLAYVLGKIGFILYAIIALWYVLDTAREAFNIIGAPFRFIKSLIGFAWLIMLWILDTVGSMWEK